VTTQYQYVVGNVELRKSDILWYFQNIVSFFPSPLTCPHIFIAWIIFNKNYVDKELLVAFSKVLKNTVPAFVLNGIYYYMSVYHCMITMWILLSWKIRMHATEIWFEKLLFYIKLALHLQKYSLVFWEVHTLSYIDITAIQVHWRRWFSTSIYCRLQCRLFCFLEYSTNGEWREYWF
jgi:hypothetical protein